MAREDAANNHGSRMENQLATISKLGNIMHFLSYCVVYENIKLSS